MTNNLENYFLNFYEKIEYQYNNRGKYEISSGFHDLDSMLGGFHKSELTIIAGRPSMGKTALALNISQNIAIRQGKPVLFVSYELNSESFVHKLVASEAEVDLMRIRLGYMQPKDWEKINKVLSEDNLYNNLKLLASCTLDYKELANEIMQFANNNPNGIIFIDYFQLIKLDNKEDRYVELSTLACQIKRLAVEIDLPIIMLSQISKKCEERVDKRPQIADLAECDALAQHSDNLIFIYRDEYYDRENSENRGKAELLLLKQKNGPVGYIELLFQASIGKFKNWSKSNVF